MPVVSAREVIAQMSDQEITTLVDDLSATNCLSDLIVYVAADLSPASKQLLSQKFSEAGVPIPSAKRSASRDKALDAAAEALIERMEAI